MSKIPKDLLLFLKDLEKNNNREWFHANKKRYETSVKNPFKELIGEIIKGLNKAGHEIEIEPKDMIFRINRDIRFSKDKSPYKTHVGAIISKLGRKGKDFPGYYLHIQQGALMMGGGAYFLERSDLQSVRQHIMGDTKALSKLLKAKAFKEKFETIKGDANKRIPKEFQDTHQSFPLIANKQFYYMAEIDPKLLFEKDAIKQILTYFKAGRPINNYLIEAMGR